MTAIRATVAVLALATLAVAGSSRAAETEVALAGIQSVVWTPDGPVDGVPVVVFSHGIALCATQSRYLTEAAARNGYLVVAPNHADANCLAPSGTRSESDGFAGKPAILWTDGDFENRRDDVRKVIAAMRADERYRNADYSRIGVVGHSLGGYTVLGLAGAWPSWKLENVRAVVALSPYTRPFARTNGIGKLHVPAMFQGGTADVVFTPPLKGAYEDAPAPKVYVEFRGASHFSWTDGGAGGPEMREAMAAWTIAFLDRHVKGRTDAAFPNPVSPGISKVLRAPAR
jgi:predicted dienelactone hydrolase